VRGTPRLPQRIGENLVTTDHEGILVSLIHRFGQIAAARQITRHQREDSAGAGQHRA
jgi:hypothetical protein